jgi:hypothetical protein
MIASFLAEGQARQDQNMATTNSMGLMARMNGLTGQEKSGPAGTRQGSAGSGNFSLDGHRAQGQGEQEPHYASSSVSDLTQALTLESWQVLNRAAETTQADPNSFAAAAYGYIRDLTKRIPEAANSDHPPVPAAAQ